VRGKTSAGDAAARGRACRSNRSSCASWRTHRLKQGGGVVASEAALAEAQISVAGVVCVEWKHATGCLRRQGKDPYASSACQGLQHTHEAARGPAQGQQGYRHRHLARQMPHEHHRKSKHNMQSASSSTLQLEGARRVVAQCVALLEHHVYVARAKGDEVQHAAQRLGRSVRRCLVAWLGQASGVRRRCWRDAATRHAQRRSSFLWHPPRTRFDAET